MEQVCSLIPRKHKDEDVELEPFLREGWNESSVWTKQLVKRPLHSERAQ